MSQGWLWFNVIIGRNMQQIYLFAALAALIIFMGAFNFMTLSTARASLRSKEIGVRKVNGAKRKKLKR